MFAVPVTAPAAMVSGKSVTARKSVPAVAVPDETVTVTTVGVARGAPSSVPVTCTPTAPPTSSRIPADGTTVSITFVEGMSMSSTVTATGTSGAA